MPTEIRRGGRVRRLSPNAPARLRGGLHPAPTNPRESAPLRGTSARVGNRGNRHIVQYLDPCHAVHPAWYS